MDSARNAVGHPPVRDLFLLGVAVLGISSAAPLVAATAVPVLAIAMWRCGLGALVTAPYVLGRRYGELRGMRPLAFRGAALSGATLAAHFALWMSAVRFTSVASTVALSATQPIWAALFARMRGGHVPRRAWTGILLAAAGVFVLSGSDFSASGRALFGDVLALAGTAMAAVYVSIGERVRKEVTTSVYTFVVYTSAALVLVVACLVTGAPVAGYSAADWAKIAALTVLAQLVGHTLMSHVLSTTSATVTSLAILFEAPGAAVIAALWLGQRPSALVLPAFLLLAAGAALVITSGRTPAEVTPPG